MMMSSSSSSPHELLYFDAAGRAEAIRICLTIAKIDWKDSRFQPRDWPAIKPTTPLGSVPVLKIDGVEHVQSIALGRYAGRLAGLYPQDDPLEGLIVDEVLESCNELMSKIPTRRAADLEGFEALRKDFETNTMARYASFVESIIQRNGGVGVVSSLSLSIADLAIHGLVATISSGDWDHINPKFFESYPGIMATAKSVVENEVVKAYYAGNKDEQA